MRTSTHRCANRADLAIFNLSGQLQELATITKSAEIDELSRRLMGSRSMVREHMHPNDQKATEDIRIKD